jgi:DNA-binding NtrC family response regulator
MNVACAMFSHGLVGTSPQIAQIRQLIPRLSRSQSPVLLLGETGVGKEVVAHAIHDSNPVGNFVPIDCGSLVGPLMESELFGHVRGAFTGATENKKGLIELANGGSAFFDEIGDLTLDMQVKLLRILQEREYRPVGSLIRHKVELRVIAATHRDLEQEVARGNFRQDLFYRLNVVTIRIAPLRERKDDIEPMLDYFFSQISKPYSLTHEARTAMTAYDWPGNVRELSNCVQRMVALNSGPLLHTADLPPVVLKSVQAAREVLQMTAVAGPLEGAFRGAATRVMMPPPESLRPQTILSLAELERKAIIEALHHTRGDRSMAAHMLGIGRTTLYRKLKEYKLEE